MKLDRRLANQQNDYPVDLTVIAQRHSQVFPCVTSVLPVVNLHSKLPNESHFSLSLDVCREAKDNRTLARAG